MFRTLPNGMMTNATDEQLATPKTQETLACRSLSKRLSDEWILVDNMTTLHPRTKNEIKDLMVSIIDRLSRV